MRMRMLTAATLGVALCSAAVAPPALAQTTPAVSAPSAEAIALGRETMSLLMSHVDFQTLLAASLQKVGQSFESLPGRPEWADLAGQAAREESEQISTIMEQRIGEQLARYYTLDELRAGVAFLRTPAGDAFARGVGAGSRHETAPPMSEDAKRGLANFARSPAGRAWLEKLRDIKSPLDAATGDMTADFTIGFLQHLLEHMEQSEAARRAQGQ